MRSIHTSKDTPINIAIIVLSGLILWIDWITRLGISEWVFYLVPVVLTIFQRRKHLPLTVAASASTLIALGYFLSPDGGDPVVSIINRSIGAVALFGVALLAYRIIIERAQTRHLLWLQQGQAEIARSMIGEQEMEDVGNNLLRVLADTLRAQVGVLYRIDGRGLIKTGSFAFDPSTRTCPEVRLGQGLAGQVAIDGKLQLLQELPDDYIRISSAIGNAKPRSLLIAPITAEGDIVGVVELGFTRDTERLAGEVELMRLAAESIGIAVRSAAYRQYMKELLEETQRQGEELQAQQEELRTYNKELETQEKVLLDSQARLEHQQAELEQTNVQLEEQTQMLEHQKDDLLKAQRTLENNAAELERTNRYKTEFLANMSHELRTPLNSSLILSHILAENKTGTLSEAQVRYAKTIHTSNNELLAIINDILDLSKIEADHTDIHPERLSLAGIVEPLRQAFEPLARDKGLAFRIDIQPGAPLTIVSDAQRLQQILKNLVSNAIKFTDAGEIVLQIAAAAGARVIFSVRDSGIGIPAEQQDIIFEAFRQADGSTSRKYGGTGLGLSISRELARLLDGTVQVQSTPGSGSVFTLEVSADLKPAQSVAAQLSPLVAENDLAAKIQASRESAAAGIERSMSKPAATEQHPAAIADDRRQRQRDRLILIIEDDLHFARILLDLAHEMGFDVVHASTADEALRLTHELKPSAIVLDVGLPDHSGLSVLERMKRDPAVRHIPIHMMSVDDHIQTALQLGAIGYALKPVAREELVQAVSKIEQRLQQHARRVLVVEDDPALRESIALLLDSDGVEITTTDMVSEALTLLANNTFDCVVMDLMLADGSGFDLLEKMAEGGKYSFPPVIIYTGRTLSRDEEQRLRQYSRSIIIKGARSPERLLDEVTLFLHQIETTLPPRQQELLLQARQRDAVFEGRRILVAEDDVRNIFALTNVLEPLGAVIEIARNGKEAVERLQQSTQVTPSGTIEVDDIDLVLMDIMMPEMDGLSAMRVIRKQPALATLPIIALTAKAMPEDRRNCLDAGASDYIAKPINVDQLVSLCRVWMPK